MARDHFVYWDKERPTAEQVLFVCEDFMGAMGDVEQQEDRIFINLLGNYSSPIARIHPDLAVGARSDNRWIEVITDDDGLDVLTRMQDELTNVIALGLAQVFARVWKGRLEHSALAQALYAATALAVAELEYRQAIVEMSFVLKNISVESFDELKSAQDRLNRAKAGLREAGGEP